MDEMLTTSQGLYMERISIGIPWLWETDVLGHDTSTNSAENFRLARVCRCAIERPGARQKPLRFLPLKPRQIRILQLYNNTGDELRGYLSHVNVDQPDKFVALSYVWSYTAPVEAGTTPPHIEEWLYTPGGRIKLSPALSRALSVMKGSMRKLMDFCYDKPDEHSWFTSPIWCDAICINQEDDKEKSVQVRLMTEIYSRAAVVFAYLGDSAEDSQHAIQILADVGNKAIAVSKVDQQWNDMVHSEEVWNHLLDGTPTRKALTAFISRPWFRRVWIIQEAIVCENLVLCCGNYSISWRQLTYGIMVLHEAFPKAREVSPTMFEPLTEDVGLATEQDGELFHHNLLSASLLLRCRTNYRKGGREHLYHLVRNSIFRAFGAKDKKDHLFALLGLSLEAKESRLLPDYEQPWETIAKKYTVFFYDQGHALDLLLCASAEPTDNLLLPSWCPDWSEPPKPGRSFDSVSIAGKGKPFCSGGQQAFVSSIETGSNEFKTFGIAVDKLVGRSITSSNQTTATKIDTMMVYLERISGMAQRYRTGESFEEIRWRTLVANRDMDGNEAPMEWGNMYRYWRSTICQRRNKTWNLCKEEQQELGRVLIPFLDAAAQNHNNELFETAQGYIGFASGRPEVGDEVFVVVGCPVPILLRTLDKSMHLYKLVGQCYAHGLMEGEIFNDPMVARPQEIRIK